MTKRDRLNQRLIEIEQSLKSLPIVPLYDEDGELNEDAYQEKLEHSYYKNELYDQKAVILKSLERDIDLDEEELTIEDARNDSELNGLENQSPEC